MEPMLQHCALLVLEQIGIVHASTPAAVNTLVAAWTDDRRPAPWMQGNTKIKTTTTPSYRDDKKTSSSRSSI